MSQPPPWPPPPGGQGPQYPPYSPYPSGQPPRLPSAGGGTILTLGLLGLLLCNLLGPFAAVMGGKALTAIDRGQADPSERGSVNAGRIMGIISTVFLVLSVLVFVVALASPSFRQGFSEGFEKSYHAGSSPNR